MSVKTSTTENARGPPAGSWEFINFLHFYADFPIWASVHFFLRRKKSLLSGFREVCALKMFKINMNTTLLQCNLESKKCVAMDSCKPVSLANLEQPAKVMPPSGSLEYSAR